MQRNGKVQLRQEKKEVNTNYPQGISDIRLIKSANVKSSNK